MRFFGRLLDRALDLSVSEIADDDIGIGSEIITIPSREFFGPSSKSPNGRYTLAWSDGGPDQSRKGRWILVDRGKVIAEGKMPRPNDGKVADNGTFVLNDWGSLETLSGTFAAFTPVGAALFTRKLKANLFNNGLSHDGRWAACQTANAPNEDGGRLFVFDLQEGREIGAFQPESGWAKDFNFSTDGQTITLCYHDGGSFRYHVDGAFLDRNLWLASGLQSGDLLVIERILSEANGKPSSELVELLLPAINRGLKLARYNRPKSQARGYRLRGICLDATGQLSEALLAYQEALTRDPKVGVKRRLEQIRKILKDAL